MNKPSYICTYWYMQTYIHKDLKIKIFVVCINHESKNVYIFAEHLSTWLLNLQSMLLLGGRAWPQLPSYLRIQLKA